MGICWYCHWGWAKPVVEIYDRAEKEIRDDAPLLYGPAHIVWADENFGNDSIKWCLEHFDEFTNNHTKEELTVVKRTLEELLSIPENIRCPEPSDYDGEHPENYPPTAETIRR